MFYIYILCALNPMFIESNKDKIYSICAGSCYLKLIELKSCVISGAQAVWCQETLVQKHAVHLNPNSSVCNRGTWCQSDHNLGIFIGFGFLELIHIHNYWWSLDPWLRHLIVWGAGFEKHQNCRCGRGTLCPSNHFYAVISSSRFLGATFQKLVRRPNQVLCHQTGLSPKVWGLKLCHWSLRAQRLWSSRFGFGNGRFFWVDEAASGGLSRVGTALPMCGI